MALTATSLEEAATVAETLKDADLRSWFYRLASDALPKTDRARKLELLDKALLHARAETSSPRQARWAGEDRLPPARPGRDRARDAGLARGPATGRHAAEARARGRTRSLAQARGRFAAKLARIDARAALALAEGFSDADDNSFKGGVALALADRDPADRSESSGD